MNTNFDEKTKKINSKGVIHPLQLQIDKIQFLVDKLFEFARINNSQEVGDLLMKSFVAETAILFKNAFVNYVKILPIDYNDKISVLEKLLEGFKKDCLIMLESEGEND